MENMKQKRVKAGTSQDSAKARRDRFIQAYIANGGNGTQAAITAGFSPKAADTRACQLMQDVRVTSALAKRQAELQAKYALTADDVIKSLAQTMYFDPRKLYREDGSLKSVNELDDDTAMALAQIEVVEMAGEAGAKHVPIYTKKVKWLDKNTAREQAMKHLGLFEQDNAQKNGIRLDTLPREMLEHIREKLGNEAISVVH